MVVKNSFKMVSGIVLILTLSILCWKVFGNNNCKNNHSVTPKTPEKKRNETAAPQLQKEKKVSVKTGSEKRNQKKSKKKITIDKESYNTVDELLKLSCRAILDENTFTSPLDFLEKLIRLCGLYAKEDNWYKDIPQTEEQLEAKLKELGLYQDYITTLENKYKK